ncbi:MAG TPA: phosphoglycerate mutase family protein [Pyrinomonadaceae bacterium]|jgi:broad specificity phosphatase PhoE|nr:phosphoglycerate mutase family protein [Pyrinomonadaceae bacterium]
MEQANEPATKLRTIVVFSMLFAVLGAVIVFAYFTTFARPVTTIILVRHAEKNIEPNNPDPDLSPEGLERAQEIARVFGETGINAIYATQYKRTQQTVKPLSDRTGVAVKLLQANQTDELVNQLQTTNRGQTVFIAGHNNTVPAIVSTLSGQTYPTIPESEFDNLYIVTIYRFGKAKVVKMKYGKSSTQGVGTGTMVPMNK